MSFQVPLHPSEPADAASACCHAAAPQAAANPGRATTANAPISRIRLTTAATLHCLSGCAIGEFIGLTIGVTLATALSLYETFSGGHTAWFDGVLMLLFFLLAGRMLDAMMRAGGADYATVHRGVYARSADMTLAFEASREKVASLLGASAQVVIVLVGGRMVLSGDLSIGTLAAFVRQVYDKVASTTGAVSTGTLATSGRPLPHSGWTRGRAGCGARLCRRPSSPSDT